MDIQQEAENFIQTSSCFNIIQSHGQLYFTGSYFLNTMTWHDIDVQLGLEHNQDPKDILSQICAGLIKEKDIKRTQYIDFFNYPRPPMTKGFCLSIMAFDPSIQDFWKIDLWVLDPLSLQENQFFMIDLKNKMTPQHHALIMSLKNEWTSLYGRPPKMASYYLYQAVILKDMKNKEDIINFLTNNNVNI